MSTKLLFKRGDGSIVVVVGALLAASLLISRLAIAGGQLDTYRWARPLVFLGASLLVTGCLVSIQRMRIPNSALQAAIPGLVLALIPVVVNFAMGDLTTTDAVARHLVNVVAIPAASVLIYTWTRRRAGGHSAIGRPGASTT